MSNESEAGLRPDPQEPTDAGLALAREFFAEVDRCGLVAREDLEWELAVLLDTSGRIIRDQTVAIVKKRLHAKAECLRTAIQRMINQWQP